MARWIIFTAYCLGCMPVFPAIGYSNSSTVFHVTTIIICHARFFHVKPIVRSRKVEAALHFTVCFLWPVQWTRWHAGKSDVEFSLFLLQGDVYKSTIDNLYTKDFLFLWLSSSVGFSVDNEDLISRLFMLYYLWWITLWWILYYRRWHYRL